MKWRAALGALCLGLLLAGCGAGKFADEAAPLTASDAPPTSSEAAPSSPGADVTPTAVRIPSIGVNNNEMMQVGLNPDRSLEVPPYSQPKLIAWFKLGPLPGDSALCPFSAGCVQPAVLNSHVNADGVQGGFAKLSSIKVGATVSVDRSDNRTATFQVTKVLVFKKTAFDTKSVYGVAGPSLVLVTCGPGTVVAGSYLNQTVVVAKLTSLKPKTP